MGLAWDGSPRGVPGTGDPARAGSAAYPRATTGAVRVQAARMKHGQLVTRVGELALEVGARYGAELQICYNPDSRKIRTRPPFRRGFPDLVIVGPGGVLFAELKCADDTVSAEQRGWLARLTGAGQTTVIWEPLDTYTGRIETELAALCVRSPYLDRRAIP